MAFLRRNLELTPRHEAAYKVLLRPQLEYAAPIWNHKLQIQQVEKMQRTAVKYVDLQAMEEYK